MKKVIFGLYGGIAYLLFLGVFSYLTLWENNLLTPTQIDTGGTDQMLWMKLGINVMLLLLFFVPHSVMARKWFKEWWTQYIPKELERSTYVFTASALLGLVVVFWQPIPITIYDLSGSWVGSALTALSFIGFGLVVWSSFQINHFDLFGLKQVYMAVANKEQRSYTFVTPFLYKLARHPLYLGLLIAFWCNAQLTAGHLLFSGLATAYIFVGTSYEEKDLRAEFGARYNEYASTTPKFLPSVFRFKAAAFMAGIMAVGLVAGYLIGPIQ